MPNDEDRLLQDFTDKIKGLGLEDLRELTGQILTAGPPAVGRPQGFGESLSASRATS